MVFRKCSEPSAARVRHTLEILWSETSFGRSRCRPVSVHRCATIFTRDFEKERPSLETHVMTPPEGTHDDWSAGFQLRWRLAIPSAGLNILKSDAMWGQPFWAAASLLGGVAHQVYSSRVARVTTIRRRPTRLGFQP